MARYCGNIGFSMTVETAQDVWEPIISERRYYGDILSARKRTERGEGLNDDYSLSNRISIIADPFAETHLSEMCYAVLNGTKWKIRSREIQYPRIILDLGEVFKESSNEQED